MSRVYEGFFRRNISEAQTRKIDNSDGPITTKGYVLTSNGTLYKNGSRVSSSPKFYFFDLRSGTMHRYCPGHGVNPVTNRSRVDDRESGKIYLYSDKGWIVVSLPTNPLPDITIRYLDFDQTEYKLNVSKNLIIVPLKYSNFINLENRVIDVTEVRESATLAYLTINPISCNVVIIYEILLRKIESKAASNSLVKLTTNYYVDSTYGNLDHTLPDAVRIVSIKQLTNMVAITKQLKKGICITFIHAVEGNDLPKDIPQDTLILPSSDFKQIVATSRNTEKQIVALANSTSKTEIIEITYINERGQEVTQHLFLEECSIYDRQYNIFVDVYPGEISENLVDVSEKVLSKLPLSSKAKQEIKSSDVYYLGEKSGYDLLNKSKFLCVQIQPYEINSLGYTIQRQFLLSFETPRIYNVYLHIYSEKVETEELIQ